MPRLLSPLLLLLPKRRLVNQEISPLRRIHHRRAGPRVTGKHDQPPRAPRAHTPPPPPLLPPHPPRLHLGYAHLERNPSHATLKRLRHHLLRPFPPIQPHRLRSHL